MKTHLRNLHYMRSFKTSGDVCPPPDFTSYPMTTKESDDIFSERSQHSGNLRHFLRDRSKGPPPPFPCAQVLRTLLRREDEEQKTEENCDKKTNSPQKFPAPPPMKERARPPQPGRCDRVPSDQAASLGISRGGSRNVFPGACRPRMNSLSRGVPGTPSRPRGTKR